MLKMHKIGCSSALVEEMVILLREGQYYDGTLVPIDVNSTVIWLIGRILYVHTREIGGYTIL